MVNVAIERFSFNAAQAALGELELRLKRAVWPDEVTAEPLRHDIVRALTCIGTAELALGRPAQAAGPLREALRLLQQLPSTDAARVADVRQLLDHAAAPAVAK